MKEGLNNSMSISLRYSASCSYVPTKEEWSRSSVDACNRELELEAKDLSGIISLAEAHSLAISKNCENRHEMPQERKGAYNYGGMPPEIFTTIWTYGISLSSVAVALTFLRAVRPLLEKWIEGRSGRTVELTDGDKTVKLTGTNDIEKALGALKKLTKVAPETPSTKKKRNQKKKHIGLTE